jgi:hypothetical protein
LINAEKTLTGFLLRRTIKAQAETGECTLAPDSNA